MSQRPLFNLVFIGLGWPWVGEFVGFIIIFTCFPTQHNSEYRKHPTLPATKDARNTPRHPYFYHYVRKYRVSFDIQPKAQTTSIFPNRSVETTISSHLERLGPHTPLLRKPVPSSQSPDVRAKNPTQALQAERDGHTARQSVSSVVG